MSYNLDENDVEGFEFILGGFTYKMRYPTTEELEAVQSEKDDVKQLKAIYAFISCADEKAPEIEEALKKKNIKIFQRFTNMLVEEFKG